MVSQDRLARPVPARGLSAGHRYTIQPPRTLIVDLTPPEEDILARMKQKTRYNIRLSAKKGVTVRQGSAEDIPVFNQLMFTTGARNTFGVHEPRYYRGRLRAFLAG